MANFNFNKVIIGGRLTSDVDIQSTASGVSVCSFNVAVTRKANREETDFIKCVAWRNTAEFISKYFGKGSSICVSGSIQTRSWESSEGKRFATEVVVDEAFFVDSKSDVQSEPSVAMPQEVGEVPSDDLPF